MRESDMDEPSYWVHNLDPFLIRFWGEVGIRWYGLAYILGFVAAWWLIQRWIRQQRLPITSAQVGDFVLWTGIAMILGGRLGYCLFYYGQGEAWGPPLAFLRNPGVFFEFGRGGMASHGGIAGLFLGTWLWTWRQGRSFWVFADVVAATSGIGVALGRIANFINGELWGRPTRVSWAVIFPLAGDGVPRHPSQLYAVVLEGLSMLVIALLVHAWHRRPGLTAGAAIMTYSIGRFFGEFFREPDAGYELYGGWMSKGQALTMPLFLVALLIAVWAWRRGPLPEAYAIPEADQAAPRKKQ